MAGTQVIGENTSTRSVMTYSPDYPVMGVSAATFYGGAKGADEFPDERRLASTLALARTLARPALKASGKSSGSPS